MTRLDSESPEEGQTMAEYAVILGVITPAIVLTIGLISETVGERLAAVAGFIAGS